MDKSRAAAERVRPILQAMERSIDSARRKRLHNPTDADADPAPPVQHSAPSPNGESAPRMKARPKRPSSFLNADGSPYRSQAG
jgi:hypothetical protein